MKKILFVDFDGVINSDTLPSGTEFPRLWFWPPMVQMINDIIRATGCKIVVSSDWRRGRSIAQLQDLLEDHGFAGEIVGCTGAACELFGKECPSDLERERAWEINHWLGQHLDVEEWCAIDDLVLPVMNLVLTDHRKGIQSSDVDRAVKILGRREDAGTFLM